MSLTTESSHADWVDHYNEIGLSTVPITAAKRTDITSWHERPINSSDLDSYHAQYSQGVGVRSGLGFVILDLDCDEAVQVAPAIVPEWTTAIAGRTRRPGTHYYYRCDDVPDGVKKRDPISDVVKIEVEQYDDDGNLVGHKEKLPALVELFADFQYVVAPPTTTYIRKDGMPDTYIWDRPLESVKTLRWQEIVTAHHLIGAASLLIRNYPPSGARNEVLHGLWDVIYGRNPGWWNEHHLKFSDFATMICEAAEDNNYERREEIRIRAERVREGETIKSRATVLGTDGANVAAISKALDLLFEVIPAVGEEEETPPEVAPNSRLWLPGEIQSAKFPPIEFVLDKFVVRNVATALIGRRGIGKSFVTFDWAKRMAQKGERVLIMDYENADWIVQDRFTALGLGSDHWVAPWINPPVNIMRPQGVSRLAAVIEEHEITVVIIDAFTDLAHKAGVSINDNLEMAQMTTRLNDILNMGITLIVHDHKPASNDARPKGAGEKENLLQVIWDINEVKRDSMNYPCRFGSPTSDEGISQGVSGAFTISLLKDRTGRLGAHGSARHVLADCATDSPEVVFDYRDTYEQRNALVEAMGRSGGSGRSLNGLS